jgi:IS30 family transposase
LSYTHFTLEERKYLQQLLSEGYSFRKIGAILERHPSSISREVNRNRSKHPQYRKLYNRFGYNHWRASNLYIRRRREQNRQALKPGTVEWDYIIAGLQCYWSPEAICGRWHKEFPNKIWIKHPDDQITFSMTPIILDDTDDDNEEESFTVSFVKNKQEHIFQCDTRKMQSWFGYEEALRTLYLETSSQRISFATVVTRCQVNSAEIIENRKDGELVIKSNISGFSDCVADVFYGEELLAENQEIYTS